MGFRTSVNVDSNVYVYIMKICDEFHLSVSVVIKDLAEITIKSFNIEKASDMLTEYQNHSPELWKKMDYILSDSEFEFLSYARLKYRISISKIIFIGFVLFGSDLIYRYKNRLKKYIDFKTDRSYVNTVLKYQKYKKAFKKRLNLSQKE